VFRQNQILISRHLATAAEKAGKRVILHFLTFSMVPMSLARSHRATKSIGLSNNTEQSKGKRGEPIDQNSKHRPNCSS
jgi:hypothetical protein